MSKHTPGPWRYWLCAVDSDSGMRDYAEVQSENGPVARIAIAYTTAPDMSLIAAAPNLYSAAESARCLLIAIRDGSMSRNNQESMIDEAIDELEKAAAKARGESC